MATDTAIRATLDDLMKVDGKAELINGRIVTFMPTGEYPGWVAGRIFKSLDDHAEQTCAGRAYADGPGYAVPELSSGRESFQPDASFRVATGFGKNMKFIQAAPTFAVEVRSDGDYGPKAERQMAAKRADYFEAGTLVVWDVDTEGELIRSYRRDRPDEAEVFRRGEVAHAEPALPGWRLEVDRAFGPRAE